MKTRMIALCCLLSLGCAENKPSQLEGFWVLQSVEFNGIKVDIPNEVPTRRYLTIRRDGTAEFALLPNIRLDATYTEDQTKTPKILDLYAENKPLRFIYSLEGRTLKLCGSGQMEIRPEKLTGEKDSMQYLYILRREE